MASTALPIAVNLRDSETTRSAIAPRTHAPLSERALTHANTTDTVMQPTSQSLPNSQDSNHTFSSLPSSAGPPRFQPTSSNVSVNTEATLPSSVASFEHDNLLRTRGTLPMAHVSSADWRPAPAGVTVIPGLDSGAVASPQHSPPNSNSPNSITSPASVSGTKRTASGAMKRPESTCELPTSSINHHSRNDSVQSTTSRTGILAADLKTKLSYAMLKVQNGWQQKNIDQIEQITSQQNSPTSSAFPEGSRRPRYSPTTGAASLRRVSSSSNDSDSYLASPAPFTPSKGSASRFPSKSSSSPKTQPWSSRPFPQNPYNSSLAASGVIAAHSNLAAATSNPVLAPAADISQASHNRDDLSPYRTAYAPVGQRKQPRHSTKAPQTPIQGNRPTPKRTATETAALEKDALDTLLSMGSPAYKQSSQGSKGLMSPPGSEVRRTVAFDDRTLTRTPGQSTSSGSASASPSRNIPQNHGSMQKPEKEAPILDAVDNGDDGSETNIIRSAVRV
ncbi:MAG: hypothetical protein M1820_010647 [Bogoriella megaspora]|nr:MAG: hypothetical protein M1820_010647 [Bogoriella megaspora]